ncbi:hypothetical protein [Desulfosarcina sp.]|uniref:hypothetical protein n=1 Tax=Desulfosarcina sp. TaxID=2027861 RepID=UPI0035693E36
MDSDLLLKGKYTFRAGSRKVVMVKKSVESLRHVVMKALLWALYLPTYNRLQVEVPIGYRYKPDLVQNGPDDIQFWAEAGSVGSQKLRRVLKRFPHTHFALATWGGPLDSMIARVARQAHGMSRMAPIDVIGFPVDADGRFIDDRGTIRISHDDLNWQRIH